VRDVLHRNTRPVYSDSQCQTLASGFSQFFVDKLIRIHQSISTSLASTKAPGNRLRRHCGPTLTQLPSTSPDELLKLLKSSRLKPSPGDVLPSSLLRSSADVLAPVIAHLANLSLAECRFPAAFKTAQVRPLLKKPGLDKEHVQLPTDIQPSDSVEGHRAAGQTPVTPALLAELFTAAVSVPPRLFHRDCAAACHKQCIHRRGQQEGHRVGRFGHIGGV